MHLENTEECNAERDKIAVEFLTRLGKIIETLHLNIETEYNRNGKSLELIFPETEDYKPFIIPFFAIKEFTWQEFVSELEANIHNERDFDNSVLFLYKTLNKTNKRLADALMTIEKYYKSLEILLNGIKSKSSDVKIERSKGED